jgi:hypothetical protein
MAELVRRQDNAGVFCRITLAAQGARNAPGSASPLPESPAVLETITKDEVVTEAKEIVDAPLNK